MSDNDLRALAMASIHEGHPVAPLQAAVWQLLDRAQAAEVHNTRLQILSMELIQELGADPVRVAVASGRAVDIQTRLEDAEARVAELEGELKEALRRDVPCSCAACNTAGSPDRSGTSTQSGVPSQPVQYVHVEDTRDQAIADLLTLIDFCNLVIVTIYSDYDSRCAIRDAHDMAHVLTGGDRARDWTSIKYVLKYDEGYWPESAGPDVRLRMRELLERLEAWE